MKILLSFRVPRELHQEIRVASAKKGISLSKEILYRLGKYSELLEENAYYKQTRQLIVEKQDKHGMAEKLFEIVVQTNLLLRKMARNNNSQLIMETDEQLAGHLRGILEKLPTR